MKRFRHKPTVSMPYDLELGVKITESDGKLYDVPASLVPVLPPNHVRSIASTVNIPVSFLPPSFASVGDFTSTNYQPMKMPLIDIQPSHDRSMSIDTRSRSARTKANSLRTYNQIVKRTDPQKFIINSKFVGEGQFSKVYLSTYRDRPVAIKVMKKKKSMLEYIQKEVTMMANLRCPDLVDFEDAYEYGDKVYLFMEYMSGGTLTNVVNYIQCTEENIAYFARHILKGIKYLHLKNLIHRDIKSDNIFLSPNADVKIGDFGFVVDSTLLYEEDDDIIVGSPYWMAPEVIKNEYYSESIDIWAVGIICRQLAEGQTPYSMLPPKKAMELISTRGIPEISHIRTRSADFIDFLHLCNNMDPNKRPTAAELLQHKFIQKRSSKEVIQNVIAQAKQAAADDIF